MVYREQKEPAVEEWAEVGNEVPGYTVDDPVPPQSQSAAALDIRPGDIVIAIMGVTGSGKSTFISHFVDGVVVGHGLEACTSKVGIYSCPYDTKNKIYFVDTPGFDDTYKSDTDILREIADWLSQAYGKDIKLTGIIYLHRILDVRMGGSAMKNLRMFKKLCGDDALPSVVLATTWWKGVDPIVGAQREKELATMDSFWAGMIAKGSRMFRQDNDVISARQIVDYLVDTRRPVTLKIQEELVEEKKTLDQTGAGIEVDSQLATQRKEFEAKLLKIQADMAQAIKDRDRDYQEDLMEFKRETEERMRKAEEDRLRLQMDREELRRQMDAEFAQERIKIVEEMRANNERMLEHEHQLKMMAAKNANDLAQQKLEFEIEKERAERMRLAAIIREKEESSCAVM